MPMLLRTHPTAQTFVPMRLPTFHGTETQTSRMEVVKTPGHVKSRDFRATGFSLPRYENALEAEMRRLIVCIARGR